MIVPGSSVVRKKTTCFAQGPVRRSSSGVGVYPGFSSSLSLPAVRGPAH